MYFMGGNAVFPPGDEGHGRFRPDRRMICSHELMGRWGSVRGEEYKMYQAI